MTEQFAVSADISTESETVETMAGEWSATRIVVHPNGSYWRDTDSAIEAVFPFHENGYRQVAMPMYGEMDTHLVTCEQDSYYRCRRCQQADRVIALYRQAEDRLREQFALEGLVSLTAAGNEGARYALRIMQRELLARQAAVAASQEMAEQAMAAKRQAVNYSEGLDAMLAWHNGMVQDWRRLSMRYASHGEWCSVYEQAMEELGIVPMYPVGTVTLTVEVQIPIRAHRAQRYGASSEFVYRSLNTYDAREQIQSALSDYTFDPFDSDLEVDDNERDIFVTDVSVNDVEWGE